MVDHLFAEPGLARLYDALCEGRQDFGFYLPLVMASGSVLDVGCGTGELLRLARHAGHAGRLCGLDPARAMLDVAHHHRDDVEWVLGDLGSTTWRGEFDLIVMTGHAFQVLLEDRELRTALAAIRGALAEGGRFVFETRNPLVRAWEQWTPEHGSSEVVGGDGGVVRVERAVELPVAGDRVSFTQTFTSPAWERPQVSRSTLRFLDAGAVAAFLAEAGLTIEEQFGDWDRRALAPSSPEIITVARG